MIQSELHKYITIIIKVQIIRIKSLIDNKMGYTGELMIVHRAIDAPFISVIEYNVGDRVAQIIVRHREQIIWDEVETIEELGETERGAGGFGSTGK